MILKVPVEYHLPALLASPPVAEDATTERVLDATMALLGEHGSEATIDAIAAAAGVGRVTVFRRFGSKDALIQRLVVREIRRFLASVDAALASVDDPADRVAEAFVACVRVGATHPLARRLSAGVALERLSAGDPSPLELGRLYVAAQLAADGVADADAVADVLVRLAATYSLVPSPVVDVRDEGAARAFALRVLAPLVVGRRGLSS